MSLDRGRNKGRAFGNYNNHKRAQEQERQTEGHVRTSFTALQVVNKSAEALVKAART